LICFPELSGKGKDSPPVFIWMKQVSIQNPGADFLFLLAVWLLSQNILRERSRQ